MKFRWRICSLKKDDQSKLIELLLIVGGLFGVFKLNGYMILLFIYFLFFGIAYFIFTKSETQTHVVKSYIEIAAFMVAASFSAIFAYLIAQLLSSDIVGTLVVGGMFWVFSFQILYSALSENKQ